MDQHGSSTADIDRIHDGTAIYTVDAEIDRLLDAIGWPEQGGSLMDPGCGDGNMLLRALLRLHPMPGDTAAACRIKGQDFHDPSVAQARHRYRDALVAFGWSVRDATSMATQNVTCRDYLLEGCDGRPDTMLANPPYWRRTNLPASYMEQFDRAVPRRAKADMLHAYIERMTRDVSPTGTLAMVTSDRWLVNQQAAALREAVGGAFRVASVRRLDTASSFHRPKGRTKGTPPRVHAVALVLSAEGRAIDASPFRMDNGDPVGGVPLGDLVELRLAPWLGPDGIFTVAANSGLPSRSLVPAIEPRDIDMATGRLKAIRRWAIVTGDAEPDPAIMSHLRQNMGRMPARGIRKVAWHPPERFDRHLPLDHDAILVPRIAKRLTGIRLPRGHLPTNHSLVAIVPGNLSVDTIIAMLDDERVQKAANAVALMVEDGYRSYTATLLRAVIIPYDLIPVEMRAAA